MTLSEIADQLTEKLIATIEKEDNASAGDLASVEHCMQLCASVVEQLNNAIISTGFVDVAEEVAFFKQRRPMLEGRLYYYTLLMRSLAAFPLEGLGDRLGFYRSQLRQVQEFYAANREMYLYYKLAHDHLDAYYFLRSPSVTLLAGQVTVGDGRIMAAKSSLMAAFYGYELFHVFLDQMMTNSQVSGYVEDEPTGGQLTWTGPISGIVEMIYALNELGAFNGKKMEVIRVANFISRAFNIQLGNVYKTYEACRIRKKSRTPYLDSMIRALTLKYEHDDLHSLG